jgi:hypothetical protein
MCYSNNINSIFFYLCCLDVDDIHQLDECSKDVKCVRIISMSFQNMFPQISFHIMSMIIQQLTLNIGHIGTN